MAADFINATEVPLHAIIELRSRARPNIGLSSVWISKIVFYHNGINWDYRQYEAPSRRKELCNCDICWFQLGLWCCWPWNHVEKIRLLDCYGIWGDANMFFRSHLTKRRQFTVANSVKSDTGIVKSGVPQWLVLGPLFFLLYINDIHRAVGMWCCSIICRWYLSINQWVKFSRIRHWEVWNTNSPCHLMSIHIPTDLSRVKPYELDSPSLWCASIQPTRLHCQLALAPGSGADIHVSCS